MKEALSSSETFLQELHGVTVQKTPFFLVTAVKTSNLTFVKAICVNTIWITLDIIWKVLVPLAFSKTENTAFAKKSHKMLRPPLIIVSLTLRRSCVRGRHTLTRANATGMPEWLMVTVAITEHE
jgi:hypothetical protein